MAYLIFIPGGHGVLCRKLSGEGLDFGLPVIKAGLTYAAGDSEVKYMSNEWR